MKKLLFLVFVCCTLLGCSSTPSSTNEPDELLSQLTVTEYPFKYSSMEDTNYVLVIKNNSPYTLKIEAKCTATDKSGKLIGATSSKVVAVESGYEVCLSNYFDEVGSDNVFEYELEATRDSDNRPVLSDLEYEISKLDDKAIITCKNKGDEAAGFVQGVALFFNDGALVRLSSEYFTDDDSELKPGKTINKEFDAFEEFDDVKIYFSGRR